MRTTFYVDFSSIVCLFAAAGLFGLSPWFGGERERERVLKENPIFQYFFFPTNLCFDSCDFLGDLLP
jgi:hypothetical protein